MPKVTIKIEEIKSHTYEELLPLMIYVIYHYFHIAV
jgi:hypothetical protein